MAGVIGIIFVLVGIYCLIEGFGAYFAAESVMHQTYAAMQFMHATLLFIGVVLLNYGPGMKTHQERQTQLLEAMLAELQQLRTGRSGREVGNG